ncbi:hypothetical protein BGZ46_005168, partial [Entomortierella lignicola]
MSHPKTLFCIVEGEDTSKAFPVPYIYGQTYVGDLKDIIKAVTTPTFDAISARELTLWQVSIPISLREDSVVNLDSECNRQMRIRKYDRKTPQKLHAMEKVSPHLPSYGE